MGLIKKKDYMKFETRLIVLEMLKEYGIEPEDLHYLHDALKIVKDIKENKPVIKDNKPKIDEKTKQEYTEKASKSMTPAEFIDQFARESEEFYPYGKPKDNN